MRFTTVRNIALAAAATFLLAGCLTSKGLLFTETNARATPLGVGTYEVCQIEKNGPPTDCNDVAVTRDATGKYTFQIDEPGEGPTFGRFRSGAGQGAFAAQLWGEDHEDPFYFLAWREGGAFAMSMIDCDTLPGAWKDKYKAKGELEVSGSSCTVSTAGAVVSAAKAYKKSDPAKNGQRLVYKKKSA
jgi:hypothetical protein